MSERNGDKARFGRLRQQKIFRRKRTRELRKALAKNKENSTVSSAVEPNNWRQWG